MAIVVTPENVDVALGTDITAAAAEIVPAPAVGRERVVSLTVSNVNAAGGADATLDIARLDVASGTYFYGLGKTITVAVGKPVILRDVILKPGKALRLRASAAATLHVACDYLEQTVS